MVTVQSVSAATEVVVISVRSQHIVNVVVESLEAEGRSLFISLCSVVKYNIQDNFDAICMKFADQSLELCSLAVVFIGRRIAAVRCEETDRIIPPAFQKLCSVYSSCIHGFIELKNRHQFYCVDSEFFEVGDFFHKPGKGSSVLYTGGRMVSKISYMKFIDDQVTEFFFGLRDITPVKGILYNSCMVGVIPADSPGSLTGNGSGVRIQKDVVLVKKESLFWTVRTVHAIGILEFFDIKSVDDHGIDISDLVGLRERKNRKGFLLGPMEEKKLTGSSAAGMDGKVYTILQRGSSIQVKNTRTDRKTCNFSHRCRFKWMVGYKFLVIRFHKCFLRLL